jgi:hypothetical protein
MWRPFESLWSLCIRAAVVEWADEFRYNGCQGNDYRLKSPKGYDSA